MEKSKFISKIMGIYLIIVSASLLVNMKHMDQIFTGYITNPTLLFTTGLFTVIVGLLLVVSHNIWQLNWKVVITILSWLILIKALSIVFFPQYMSNLTVHFINNIKLYYMSCGVDLLLGLYLSYMGFKREG